MSNYGFGNFGNMNNDNPLAQLFKQYVPQQPMESVQPAPEPQRMNTVGISVFEINSKSDIEYIEQDKSGRMQVYVCPNEKRVYTSRFNHVKQGPDYKAFIEEEEVKLFQKNEVSADMSQIAEALGAVVNELKTMRNEIQELKNAVPVKEPEKDNRKPNGQFKKRNEA